MSFLSSEEQCGYLFVFIFQSLSGLHYLYTISNTVSLAYRLVAGFGIGSMDSFPGCH